MAKVLLIDMQRICNGFTKRPLSSPSISSFHPALATSVSFTLKVSPASSKHFLTGASNSSAATVFHVSTGGGNVITSMVTEMSFASAGILIFLAASAEDFRTDGPRPAARPGHRKPRNKAPRLVTRTDPPCRSLSFGE